MASKTHYLGPYNSPESRERYERVLGEHAARGRFFASEQVDTGLAVDDLIAGYWSHAEVYYRKDGKPTSELSILKQACRYLHRVYGSPPVDDFGPRKLKAVRRDAAEEARAQGRKVILVRLETSPEDIHGMHAAEGILTTR
ncbi:MAG: hypothetical protein ACO4CZ_06085, partial [Planctomycetota bacterium]